MNIWLPSSVYKNKPVFFLLGAFFLVLLSQNPITILFSICLLSYTVWIIWMRYKWRSSGKID